MKKFKQSKLFAAIVAVNIASLSIVSTDVIAAAQSEASGFRDSTRDSSSNIPFEVTGVAGGAMVLGSKTQPTSTHSTTPSAGANTSTGGLKNMQQGDIQIADCHCAADCATKAVLQERMAENELEGQLTNVGTLMGKMMETPMGKSCLASARQVIDLAQTLPSINISWGGVGAIVQNVVKKQIQQVTNQLFEKTCNVVASAVGSVTKPVFAALQMYEQGVNVANNWEGILANIANQQISRVTSKTFAPLYERADRLSAQFEEQGDKHLAEVQKMQDSINNTVQDVVGMDAPTAAQVGKVIVEESKKETNVGIGEVVDYAKQQAGDVFLGTTPNTQPTQPTTPTTTPNTSPVVAPKPTTTQPSVAPTAPATSTSPTAPRSSANTSTGTTTGVGTNPASTFGGGR